MSLCIGKNADFVAVRNSEGSVLRVASITIAGPLVNSGFAVPESVLESGANNDIQFSGEFLEVYIYEPQVNTVNPGSAVAASLRYIPLFNYEQPL
jgi:hypothetical protein